MFCSPPPPPPPLIFGEISLIQSISSIINSCQYNYFFTLVHLEWKSQCFVFLRNCSTVTIYENCNYHSISWSFNSMWTCILMSSLSLKDSSVSIVCYHYMSVSHISVHPHPPTPLLCFSWVLLRLLTRSSRTPCRTLASTKIFCALVALQRPLLAAKNMGMMMMMPPSPSPDIMTRKKPCLREGKMVEFEDWISRVTQWINFFLCFVYIKKVIAVFLIIQPPSNLHHSTPHHLPNPPPPLTPYHSPTFSPPPPPPSGSPPTSPTEAEQDEHQATYMPLCGTLYIK